MKAPCICGGCPACGVGPERPEPAHYDGLSRDGIEAISCPRCEGTGAEYDRREGCWIECDTCGGTGRFCGLCGDETLPLDYQGGTCEDCRRAPGEG